MYLLNHIFNLPIFFPEKNPESNINTSCATVNQPKIQEPCSDTGVLENKSRKIFKTGNTM